MVKRLCVAAAVLALIAFRTAAAGADTQVAVAAPASVVSPTMAAAPTEAHTEATHTRRAGEVRVQDKRRWDNAVHWNNTVHWNDVVRFNNTVRWTNAMHWNNTVHWNDVVKFNNMVHWNNVVKLNAAVRRAGHGLGTISHACGGALPPCYVLLRESGGYSKAKNPTSTASGLWQFIDGTWAGFGGFAHASDAPVAVQNARAVQVWAHGAGCSNWSACPK